MKSGSYAHDIGRKGTEEAEGGQDGHDHEPQDEDHQPGLPGRSLETEDEADTQVDEQQQRQDHGADAQYKEPGGIDHVVEELGLTDDQVQRYEILKATYGNKKYLFDDIYSIEEPEDEYDVPGEYLTDIEFARMLHEAESHLGLSYVWGGYSPVSGFDCSGFVRWVINHCGNGWNVGRQTANGLKVITDRVRESDVKPGDLVFFKGTYNTTGASHVGIVVDPVNHVMIHAGNPIKYSNYDTPYWRAHMYCYGRIRR